MLPGILDITPLELVLIWSITAAASLLRAFTGFGFALTAVPVFALFFEPTQVVVLCTTLVFLLGIQTFPIYRQALDLPKRWPMFAAAIPGTALGVVLLLWFEPNQFRLSLGVLTIVASVFLARFRPRQVISRPRIASFVGLLAGICNGAFAVPGPPIIVYVMATEKDPATCRGLMIGYFSFTAVLALCAFTVLGLVDVRSVLPALLAYPAMYLGDRLGYAAFLRFGAARYRPVAIGLCLLIGVAISVRALLEA
ncbi:MAG: sulfite exporter TauE/SafE family protein [Pseudomonadota bacterium]